MATNEPIIRQIHVAVDDVRFAIIAPAEQERAYRLAGEELTSVVQIYRERYPNSSEIPGAGYVSMAAIDIAFRKHYMEQQMQALSLKERLLALNQKAEYLLGVAERSL